ncbi:TIGR03084 family metal-binding protein [Rhodococcus sp. B10]|uniref:TIGR03084 family metal-binding protein n=1 Tax=Rhodococcus sp. B10 TaxID=2695876 RepID=UPI00142FEA7C|nr:TIGR03084 family metal-binding protein [Rhodococcus sp. B10]NIL78353.1 Uncharacterized protein [Rhodococcus sp. B10]
MVDKTALVGALRSEGTAIENMVRGLPAEYWSRPTPAPGWTIAHQIGHLTWTDHVSSLSIETPEAFADIAAAYAAAPTGYVDDAASAYIGDDVDDLLETWSEGRRHLADLLDAHPGGTKLAWFGPPMSSATMTTARLMETWAHGQDIADALSLPHPATAALEHIAHLGVRTRGFAYTNRGQPVPATDVYVTLAGPNGEHWEWGPSGAPDVVEGTAEDFCLVVTQRRAPADTGLRTTGSAARYWLTIAQAFAGEPTATRRSALPTALPSSRPGDHA